MPPLTRQQTLESLRSWWSDSNPNLRGPTINLHAASKPLMKLLMRRSMEAIYYANVSVSTKRAILGDLYERAYSEHDALAMQTHIFHDILKLLGDRVAVDRRLWGGARIILQRLAERDATAAATCGSLVALLCDSDVPQVVDGALWVLSRVPQIDFPPVTTGVSVELKLLARLEDILQNSSTTERSEWPLMKLLYNRRALNFITNNRDIPLSAVDGEIYGSYLLCEYVSELTKSAIARDILLRVYRGHEASEVQSNMPQDIFLLLEGPVVLDLDTRTWPMLWTLAEREDTAAVTCGSLVLLLCTNNMPQVRVEQVLFILSEALPVKFPPVTSGASVEAKLLGHLLHMLEDLSPAGLHYPAIFQILSHMAFQEDIEVSVVEANLLNPVEKLLRSPLTYLHRHIFSMLERLASHESTVIAVVRMLPLDLLVTPKVSMRAL
ncbi:hypothetical protein C8J57DRAFT_1658841 [Mycena rebaudengoi]|nr:hypothetical protein C8J57DRAFT_1658841 [Mycena rebaudengoi]